MNEGRRERKEGTNDAVKHLQSSKIIFCFVSLTEVISLLFVVTKQYFEVHM